MMMGNESFVQQGPQAYNLMMRERLQQHQQLQEIFRHNAPLDVENAIAATVTPHLHDSRQQQRLLSTSQRINRLQANINLLDQPQQQQIPQQIPQQTNTTEVANASGLIISTHYYSPTGGRRSYHNYHYNYHNNNNNSNNMSNSNSDNNNNNHINMISNRRGIKRLQTVVDNNSNNSHNNNNNNIINNATNTPTTNENSNSNNNCAATTSKRPLLINFNDISDNIVDSAMLYAIREKVLHTPAGTNFDVVCVSTPNGGRTIATHSKEQFSRMRIFNHQTAGPRPVLTSSLPVSLLKERYLISHIPMPKMTATQFKTNHNPHITFPGRPSGYTEAPTTFVNSGLNASQQQQQQRADANANIENNNNNQSANVNAHICNSSTWYRHMMEMTSMTVRCTDIFTEQEFIVRMVHEPVAKVKQAYYKLQMDKQYLRSTHFGHRLVRAAIDIVPYVTSMGDTSTERSYIIVDPKTAAKAEIAIWNGDQENYHNTAGIYKNITGHAFEDLHSYIRRKRRLGECEARAIFYQICETVRVCHRNGIILRDLKLKRFYFIDQERKRLQYESLEGCMILHDPKNDILSDKIGCPLYTAPELLCTAPTYRGKPADMWSLGVILYTMLVGQYPFYEKGSCSLIQIIRQCSAYIPNSLSRPAKSLIMSLLYKTFHNRLRIDQVFFMPWLREHKPDWSNIPYEVVVKIFADPQDFIENLKFPKQEQHDDDDDDMEDSDYNSESRATKQFREEIYADSKKKTTVLMQQCDDDDEENDAINVE